MNLPERDHETVNPVEVDENGTADTAPYDPDEAHGQDDGA